MKYEAVSFEAIVDYVYEVPSRSPGLPSLLFLKNNPNFRLLSWAPSMAAYGFSALMPHVGNSKINSLSSTECQGRGNKKSKASNVRRKNKKVTKHSLQALLHNNMALPAEIYNKRMLLPTESES